MQKRANYKLVVVVPYDATLNVYQGLCNRQKRANRKMALVVPLYAIIHVNVIGNIVLRKEMR